MRGARVELAQPALREPGQEGESLGAQEGARVGHGDDSWDVPELREEGVGDEQSHQARHGHGEGGHGQRSLQDGALGGMEGGGGLIDLNILLYSFVYYYCYRRRRDHHNRHYRCRCHHDHDHHRHRRCRYLHPLSTF